MIRCRSPVELIRENTAEELIAMDLENSVLEIKVVPLLRFVKNVEEVRIIYSMSLET